MTPKEEEQKTEEPISNLYPTKIIRNKQKGVFGLAVQKPLFIPHKIYQNPEKKRTFAKQAKANHRHPQLPIYEENHKQISGRKHSNRQNSSRI